MHLLKSLSGSKWVLITMVALIAAAMTGLSTIYSAGLDLFPPPLPTEIPLSGPNMNEPVTYITPVPPPETPGESIFHGPFRLIPFGYQGPLTYTPPRSSTPTNVATFTGNETPIRVSSLFKEPGYLPKGYRLVRIAGSGWANAEYAVFLVYEGPGTMRMVGRDEEIGIVEVRRQRIMETPIDVQIPPSGEGSFAVLETGYINSSPAVFVRFGPPFPVPGGDVQFVTDGILTFIRGEGISFEELLRIAESMG